MIEDMYKLSIAESKMMYHRSNSSVKDVDGAQYDLSCWSVAAHNYVKEHLKALDLKVGDMIEFKDNNLNIKYRHNMTNELYRYDGISIIEGIKIFNDALELDEELEDSSALHYASIKAAADYLREKNNPEIRKQMQKKAFSSKERALSSYNATKDLFPVYRYYLRPVGEMRYTKLRTKFVDKNEDGRFVALKEPVFDELNVVNEYYGFLNTHAVFDGLILATTTKDISNPALDT